MYQMRFINDQLLLCDRDTLELEGTETYELLGYRIEFWILDYVWLSMNSQLRIHHLRTRDIYTCWIQHVYVDLFPIRICRLKLWILSIGLYLYRIGCQWRIVFINLPIFSQRYSHWLRLRKHLFHVCHIRRKVYLQQDQRDRKSCDTMVFLISNSCTQHRIEGQWKDFVSQWWIKLVTSVHQSLL